MITEKDFDDMDLPKANIYEELETLSEQYLQPLFEPSRFELCTRDRRDKGIDLTYEIKRNEKHLGIRFIIQLKATKTIEANKEDGSFSKSIETSNINALSNNGHSAFYLLFDANTGTFYYEHLNDFLKDLYEKNSDWIKQKNHVLRFSKKLLPDGINHIYNATIKHGLFQRNLRERAMHISTSFNKTDRVSIDTDFNIIDDAKTRELIENLGFELINQGRWRDILSAHQKATGNIAVTPLYNLILGIANYYEGSRWDALSFLKKATIRKSELDKEMQMLLQYFDTTVRFSVELINEEEYKKKLTEIENSETVGLYIKLDNARRGYINSLTTDSRKGFENYVSEIEAIINNPKVPSGLILTAKCELILFQGYSNNHEYVKEISKINSQYELLGFDKSNRIEFARNFISTNNEWYKSVEEVVIEALKEKNYFAYFTALSNKAKVTYQFIVYISHVKVETKISENSVHQKPDNAPMLERSLEDIRKAAHFFSSIGHIENTVAATTTIYEILHYQNKMDEADRVLKEIETMIDKFDLIDYKERLESLKNYGTTHEYFKNWIEQIFKDSENRKNEFDEIREKMMLMDEQESTLTEKSKGEHHQINLYPIGYFQFPKEQKDLVYDIIGVINPKVKNQFDNMFEMVIPIANILYNPIDNEGLQDGMLADRGIDNWRNIYQIRKAFYDNKFYRFDIK